MHTFFLTGFPGFLGSSLISKLLDRSEADISVTCLVQPKYMDLARKRADEIEKERSLRKGRVRLLKGDITRDRLGLDTQQWDELADSVLEIYHLAAIYDLGVEREPARRVNLEGTAKVLELAQACASLQRFQYVSTCYVSGRYEGLFTEEDLIKGQTFNNYYEETKYLAEVEVQKAMEEGLPATIYRPAIVVGDSRTGATQKYDGPYYIMQWMMRQEERAAVPVVGRPEKNTVNLVPRDYVVDAIGWLSGQEHSAGKVYQLADPDPLTVDALLEVLAGAMHKSVLRVPLPFTLAKMSLKYLTPLEQWLGIEAEAVNYFTQPTRYRNERARHDLHSAGITCPPFNEYAYRLVSFMRAHPEIDSRAMI